MTNNEFKKLNARITEMNEMLRAMKAHKNELTKAVNHLEEKGANGTATANDEKQLCHLYNEMANITSLLEELAI